MQNKIIKKKRSLDFTSFFSNVKIIILFFVIKFKKKKVLSLKLTEAKLNFCFWNSVNVSAADDDDDFKN